MGEVITASNISSPHSSKIASPSWVKITEPYYFFNPHVSLTQRNEFGLFVFLS